MNIGCIHLVQMDRMKLVAALPRADLMHGLSSLIDFAAIGTLGRGLASASPCGGDWPSEKMADILSGATGVGSLRPTSRRMSSIGPWRRAASGWLSVAFGAKRKAIITPMRRLPAALEDRGAPGPLPLQAGAV